MGKFLYYIICKFNSLEQVLFNPISTVTKLAKNRWKKLQTKMTSYVQLDLNKSKYITPQLNKGWHPFMFGEKLIYTAHNKLPTIKIYHNTGSLFI